jgi:hypothetical protein
MMGRMKETSAPKNIAVSGKRVLYGALLAVLLAISIGEAIEIIRLRRTANILRDYIDDVSTSRGECLNQLTECEQENARLKAVKSPTAIEP